jgi:glutathione S-transferase
MTVLLSFDNPVFAAYAFYAAVLVIKMIFIQLWTGVERRKYSVPAFPEDYRFYPKKDSKAPVKESDCPPVQRVRRILLNDLENIPTFLILSFIYVLSDPSPFFATWHFRLFTLGRVTHSYFQLRAIMPHRSIGFWIGYTCYISITVQIIAHSLNFW